MVFAANRPWLSDAMFGSAVGIIAGHAVTGHEAERPFPVAVIAMPGGMAIMCARQSRWLDRFSAVYSIR